jgi:poly-gamma-glutamate capsule biosynthesis protein CapA/YwtB (metallophosphatase superfamily)
MQQPATITLALAGDTMLGRSVRDRLVRDPSAPLFDRGVAEAASGADLFVLNLECCISDGGERFPDPRKPFFFRAPPVAAQRLAELGVHAVTLANNHALDYGPVALLDTLEALGGVGIAIVGAADEVRSSREPVVLESRGFRLRVVAVSDHPREYAAGAERPGIAFADLRRDGLPDWLRLAARPASGADAVLVTPHWGPNMRTEPLPYVRRAADELVRAGATLVAGHSAHVFQGAAGRVLFDLGDFIDDYAVDGQMRNDLGILWLVTIDGDGPRRIEAVPLALDFCHTRLADHDEHQVVGRLLRERCAVLDTEVRDESDRLVVAAPPA